MRYQWAVSAQIKHFLQNIYCPPHALANGIFIIYFLLVEFHQRHSGQRNVCLSHKAWIEYWVNWVFLWFINGVQPFTPIGCTNIIYYTHIFSPRPHRGQVPGLRGDLAETTPIRFQRQCDIFQELVNIINIHTRSSVVSIVSKRKSGKSTLEASFGDFTNCGHHTEREREMAREMARARVTWWGKSGRKGRLPRV